jgi:hypothetical protein
LSCTGKILSFTGMKNIPCTNESIILSRKFREPSSDPVKASHKYVFERAKKRAFPYGKVHKRLKVQGSVRRGQIAIYSF